MCSRGHLIGVNWDGDLLKRIKNILKEGYFNCVLCLLPLSCFLFSLMVYLLTLYFLFNCLTCVFSLKIKTKTPEYSLNIGRFILDLIVDNSAKYNII